MNSKVQMILLSTVITLLIAIPVSVALTYHFIDAKYEDLIRGSDRPSIQETLQEVGQSQSEGSTIDASEAMSEVMEMSQTSEESLIPNQQTAATEEGRMTLDRHVFTTQAATYEITEEYIQTGQGGVRQPVYRLANGKSEKELWVADLRSLSSEPLKPFQGFWIFANPKQGHILYVQLLTFETENPTGKIYALNIQDKSMSLVDASVVNASHFNAAVSPDGQRYVTFDESPTGRDQALYLVDLELDSAKKIVQLSGDETLNAGGEALSSHSDIAWFDEMIIRYAVYDQTKKVPGASPEEAFLEYRTVNVGTK